MIFSIIILLLLGVITFFHYVQGLFSATLSAIMVVIAAALAVSYHEPAVNALSKGRFSDQAAGLVLILMFAAIYLLLRVIFDKVIQGNVQYPVLVDKIGAGVMGFISGCFATGIFAIAAQTLPFGPSIAGYTRYVTIPQRDAVVPTTGQHLNSFVYDEMKEDTFDATPTSSLLLPVDDMVMGMVGKLSEGALSGERTLRSVHPDYLQELFGQRLGIQVGAKHTMPTAMGKQMEVRGLSVMDFVEQGDGELPLIRGQRKLDRRLVADTSQMLLIVRVMFLKDAEDIDHLVRVSPAAVRLVTKGKNYFPVGTLEGEKFMYANRVDDPLLLNLTTENRGADFVFLVDPADVLDPAQLNPKLQPLTMTTPVFIEIKRLSREDLSGRPVEPKLPAAPDIAVMRKPFLLAERGEELGIKTIAGGRAQSRNRAQIVSRERRQENNN